MTRLMAMAGDPLKGWPFQKRRKIAGSKNANGFGIIGRSVYAVCDYALHWTEIVDRASEPAEIELLVQPNPFSNGLNC